MRFFRGSSWTWLIAVAISACATRSAPGPSVRVNVKDEKPPSLPIPADLEYKVELSIAYGREIYFQDSASAIGTDVLRANIDPQEKAELGGYLTVGDGDENGNPLPSSTVLFYTREDPPLVKYRISVPWDRAKKSSFQRITPAEALAPNLLILVRARAAALKAAGPFDQAINPVVLPAGGFGEPGDILVELLAGTEKPDTIVLGKHFRVLVVADGSRVKSVTPLSKTALVLSRRLDDGKETTAVYATQLVTDYPVETHVFASMDSGLPIYLRTARGTWLVDRDSIRFVSLPDPG